MFSGSMTSLRLSVQAVVPDQLTYVTELAVSECAVAFVVQEANGYLHYAASVLGLALCLACTEAYELATS